MEIINFLNLGDFLNPSYYVNNSLQCRMKVVQLDEISSGMLWNFSWMTLKVISMDNKTYFAFFLHPLVVSQRNLKQSDWIIDRIHSASKIELQILLIQSVASTNMLSAIGP